MDISNILEAIIAGVVVAIIVSGIGIGVTKSIARNKQKGRNNINIQNSNIGDKK
jgi:hypothetical protein|nr:hypothetical protein [uncultured Romboutsia sp.]